MNKKLLFAALSLAALTACTSDDFESQQNVAQEVSPIQFELINDNDAETRASMSGNKVVFSAADKDLFTLYHGGTVAGTAPFYLSGFENATYKAEKTDDSPAALTTPSMIKQGYAIMTWPADTTFRANGNLSIVIPQNQTDKIQNEIPYVSDLIDIKAYAAYTETAPATAYNTAGKDRKYSVYMRPMASQLNLKADYAGTDATLATLEAGDDGINPISVTSVELLTTPGGGGSDNFTTEIPLVFAAQTLPVARWNAADANNAWSHVTGFHTTATTSVDKLTTKCLTGNNGAKFLILPQGAIATGVDDGGVVVNTTYGKVVIADPATPNPHGTKYTAAEYAKAWYRYVGTRVTVATTEENVSATVAEASGDNAGKYKTVAVNPAMGMQQTINYMSNYTAPASLPVVQGEPIGVALTRYVVVNLEKLDMSDLHVKSDKQLRDVVRVWKQMNLPAVTVWLDGGQEGDVAGEFTISQKTIKKINELNNGTLNFRVKPCQTVGEVCNTIVITGSADEQELQDIAFIIDSNEDGTGVQADVALADEGTAKPWKWVGTLKVTDNGVNRIINRGTMQNAANATLATYEHGVAAPQNNIPLHNNGTWNITAGKLFVQFTVTNNKIVNISKGAEYREDGAGHIFYNYATNKPLRFGGDDNAIGVVNNKGVFASVNNGRIYNYALIKHDDKDAKTYITRNQISGSNFANVFAGGNKMGTILLPFDNKDEDNISISATAPIAEGFVSVVVTADNAPASKALDASVVGTFVNSIIVNGGIEKISDIAAQIEYVEIAQPGTEIAWEVTGAPTYKGLMVLSDVNIKLGTTVNVTGATYLDANATMYVGGTFNNNGWAGYYGNTSANVATQYVTY
ncbi:MAG: hypothetical protein IJV33_02525 [Bacteroidaceae bacterium]|nr:hypothetical protein [Bacteroidaceae bacterium]